jgi:hypothetical protein
MDAEDRNALAEWARSIVDHCIENAPYEEKGDIYSRVYDELVRSVYDELVRIARQAQELVQPEPPLQVTKQAQPFTKLPTMLGDQILLAVLSNGGIATHVIEETKKQCARDQSWNEFTEHFATIYEQYASAIVIKMIERGHEDASRKWLENYTKGKKET